MATLLLKKNQRSLFLTTAAVVGNALDVVLVLLNSAAAQLDVRHDGLQLTLESLLSVADVTTSTLGNVVLQDEGLDVGRLGGRRQLFCHGRRRFRRRRCRRRRRRQRIRIGRRDDEALVRPEEGDAEVNQLSRGTLWNFLQKNCTGGVFLMIKLYYLAQMQIEILFNGNIANKIFAHYFYK